MFTVEKTHTHMQRFIIYLFLPTKEKWSSCTVLTITYNQITFEPIKQKQVNFFGFNALKEKTT